MKKTYKKTDLPVDRIRRLLEPGPIVLVSSRWRDKTNIMTMGWHTVLEFSPSLIGCMITAANHSFEMIKHSGECVINIPTVDLLDEVIGIGNCSGSRVDKFKKFHLTPDPAERVSAPLIRECYAHFECRVVDTRLLSSYNFFIMEVVKAHTATWPKYPRTVHYRGEGVFMVSGKNISRAEQFTPGKL